MTILSPVLLNPSACQGTVNCKSGVQHKLLGVGRCGQVGCVIPLFSQEKEDQYPGTFVGLFCSLGTEKLEDGTLQFKG